MNDSDSRKETLYEHTSIDHPDPYAWMEPSHVAVNIIVAGERRVAGHNVEVDSK